MSNRLWLLWLAGLAMEALAAGSEAPAGSEAAQWLARMNRAVATLTYEGHFVYLSGQTLEGMRIRHRIVEGRPVESLLSLNGVRREVIRQDGVLTIVTHRNGREQRVQHPAGSRFSPMKMLDPKVLAHHYRLTLGPSARIADRMGTVLLFLPNDDLRYGYRLTLDRQWALPLDLSVVDAQGGVVSRIMFTDLKVEPGAAAVPAEPPSPAPPAEGPGHWRFESLPSGFRLVSHRHYGPGQQEHFIFSDGLATISAYLEPLEEGDTPFEGRARLGSINAVGRQLAQRQLTVVGEVPYKTLEQIAGGLQPARE